MAEPIPRIAGTTRAVGVIGWPVDHSLSPVIHNAAFAALGLDRVSVPLPVPPGELAPALAGLVALGFDGANVTMPHKTEAATLAASLTEDARRLRAVNTLVVRHGAIEGHNTDAPGFDRFLRHDQGFDVAGRNAVLFGAGGAARAVALALAQAGLGSLTVVVRDTARADPLLESLDGLPTSVAVAPWEEAPAPAAELVVNATPLGARGETLPEVPLAPGGLVVDLLYGAAATPLIERSRAAGVEAVGGLGLLLHQAVLSLELWTGRVAPLEVLSAAATAAISEHR